MNYIQTIANWELPGITFKRVAATKGGEYCSPCPACGGNDRFIVWPNQGSYGRFWCRQCLKSGDMIEFLRWQKGISFKEACDAVGKTLPQRRRLATNTSSFKKSKTQKEFQSTPHKRRISTDMSWLKPKPQPQDTERRNQQIDEVIKPIEEPISKEQKQPVTVETQPTSKPLTSPRLFSDICKTCAKFDIEYGTAWCFHDNSYRNHQFLKSCPIHNKV